MECEFVMSSSAFETNCIQEQKLKEIRNCLDVISGNPVDRTVSCYLLILLFLTLDKTDLYTDNEPFIQKLRGIRESVEQSLRSYLESVEVNHQEKWNICKYKLELLTHVQSL